MISTTRPCAKQADAIAQYLVPRAEGGWTFNLPLDLHDLYSEAYGRYAYAVLDETGRTLFSSRADKMPIFELDSHAAETRVSQHPARQQDHRRRQRAQAIGRPDHLGAGRGGSRPSGCDHRRHRRGFFSACRLGDASNSFGLAGHRYLHLPARHDAADPCLGRGPAHQPGEDRRAADRARDSERDSAAGDRGQ